MKSRYTFILLGMHIYWEKKKLKLQKGGQGKGAHTALVGHPLLSWASANSRLYRASMQTPSCQPALAEASCCVHKASS